MKELSISRIKVAVFAVASALFFIVAGQGTASAAVDECMWTGGGASDNFSLAANWDNCDGSGVPENGDSIDFMTGIDSGRSLNNDISNLSLSGIRVNGLYPEGDFDKYTITGNDITLTGDVVGGEESSYDKIGLDVNIIVSAGVEIKKANVSGSVNIGSNSVVLDDSSVSGGIIGSGDSQIIIKGAIGGAGGAENCETGNATQDTSFPGDNSGFSGSIRLLEGGLATTDRATDLVKNASSLTIEDSTVLTIKLDAGKNLNFGVPLISNGGDIYVIQTYIECGLGKYPPTKTLTFSGPFTANKKTTFYLLYANAVISGPVTGAKNISVTEGRDPSFTLTVGSVVSRSAKKTTTHYDKKPDHSVFAMLNNIEIIAKGATRGYTLVDGGVLKGVGTVDVLIMRSGRVEPGMSPGCLTSGNLLYEGGTVEIEIAGNKVCSEYDQQIVNGTVDLGTKTKLEIKRLDGFAPKKNDVFVILKNDGKDAITGNFSGLPEGDTVVVEGVTYRISYKGGDGNDVALTAINVPAVPNTGSAMLQVNAFAPIAATIAMVGALLLAKRRLAKN